MELFKTGSNNASILAISCPGNGGGSCKPINCSGGTDLDYKSRKCQNKSSGAN